MLYEVITLIYIDGVYYDNNLRQGLYDGIDEIYTTFYNLPSASRRERYENNRNELMKRKGLSCKTYEIPGKLKDEELEALIILNCNLYKALLEGNYKKGSDFIRHAQAICKRERERFYSYNFV